MPDNGSSASHPPLAIVGLSCLFPQAADLEEFWSNLRRGVDAITEIPATHWDPTAYFDADPKSPDMTYARRGGFLSPVPFDPLEFGIAPSNLEAIDTSQLLGLVGAKRALEHAGYGDGGKPFDRSRAGCILGVTGTLEMVIPLGARLGHPKWRQALRDAGVSDDVANDVIERIGESYVPWQENSFPGLLGNVVEGRIANRLDLGGTNCVVDAACASSLSAIHLAALELWSGRSDLVITGGVDTFNDIFMYMCFSKTPALSPTGDARPFAEDADGTILGEGVGILVLKRLADAERDGDRIYALIRGIGTSSDGAGNAVYAPKKEGQVRCLQDAYRIAGVSPDTIELIEAHGTGTKVGDATEVAGLTEVFCAAGRRGRWCALGSVKSQIGHTKAAAGAAGVIKAVLALHHRVLPTTSKVAQPLEILQADDSPFYVNTQPRPWLPSPAHPRRAGVSAFGFGGSNFHCVLEEAPKAHGLHPAGDCDWDGDVVIAAFSGESREALQRQMSSWSESSKTHGIQPVGFWRWRAAQSRAAFDPDAQHRLLIVLERDRDVPAAIATAASLLDKYADKPQWSTPDGIFYGRGPRAGKLAVLFPGQGSQSVGMLRELACRFGVMQDVLAEANEAFAALNDSEKSEVSEDFGCLTARLSEYVYPPPAFSDAEREQQDLALRATQVAQPAIGAVSLGTLAVLERYGVKAEIAAGHSYGELTALCASKRFRPAALYRLSALRGRLMAEAQEIDGGMLAVGAPLSVVEEAIAGAAIELVVANRNGPSQVVLSGRLPDIDRAAELFARRNIRGRKLPVAAAFHSPLVATASARFRPVLSEVEFFAPELPVFANSSADEYPDDADAARDLLAGQLARPVEFVQQIENMYDAGARTFLEVGPGNVLTGLVGSILTGRDHRALAVDASLGKRSGLYDLALILAQLGAGGYAVRLDQWDPQPQPPETVDPSRLRIALSGANYVKPRPPKPPRPARAVAPEAHGLHPVGFPAHPRPQDSITPHQRRIDHEVGPSESPGLVAAPGPARDVSASLAVLQRMQSETARLHRQFLEGQETALRTLETLLRQRGGTLEARNLSAAEMPAPLPPSPSGGREPPEPASMPSAPSAVPQTPVAYASGSSSLTSTVLAVVAEKTGYPVEMLQPAMSLDHDLGIDSIKRVEILSTLQERIPQLPAVTPEQLQTLHRLEDVIALLERSAGEPGASATGVMGSPAKTPVAHAPGSPALSSAVLAVVAEKTGYPVEMLQPAMSLDHDLGIDSIKRVEILSTLQERLPELPAVTPEQLQTLHRLDDVIALLERSAGEPGASATGVMNSPTKTPVAHTPGSPMSALVRAVVRAVPIDDVRQPLRFAPGGEFWITDDGELAAPLAEQISAAGFSTRVVGLDESAAASGGPLAGLVILAPRHGVSDADLWRALVWVQQAGSALRRSAEEGHAAVVATVSRLDGACGFGNGRLIDPASGGLAGLTKTVRHEWPTLIGKAIDLSDDWPSPATAVAALVDELLHAGPVEVGLSPRGRVALDIVEQPLSADGGAFPLQPDDLVIVTGGARGVTAAAAIALAERRPKLVLLGRSPVPQPEPDWLRSARDEAAIKQALARSGQATTPRELQQRCQQVLAGREIEHTLQALRARGANAEYCSVDVRDALAVRTLIERLQRDYGPVRGILHGAGVLADARLEDKTREQFDRVFETKVDGLRNVLAAVDADQLRALVLFSSFTGRYGRTGQVDYAIANEVLNKQAQDFQRRYSNCRVIAFNWGPWDGGMVHGGLKQLFAQEGIGLIPLSSGADLVVYELVHRSGDVEVLVLGPGSKMRGGEEERGNEGLQTSEVLKTSEVSSRAMSDLQPSTSVAFARDLSVARFPYLASHVLGGKAVFPVAMMVEWFAHAAMHRNPGLEFLGFDRLKVLKGVRLSADESLPLEMLASKPQRSDGRFVTSVQLASAARDQRTIHAAADVLLGAAPSEAEGLQPLGFEAAAPWTGDIYAHLFHGPMFQGIERIERIGREGIVVRSRAAAAPAEWQSQPLRGSWLADPLAIDAALQAIILWSQRERGQPCLPCGIGRYRQYRRGFPREGVEIAVRIDSAAAHLIRATVDFRDAAGRLVARMDDCENVVDGALTAAFAQNTLV
jgi:acyl transferase domain-containing protein/NAD(P)-dependent dehydrogenase (short-subunit alcohol dehydrogenase family)